MNKFEKKSLLVSFFLFFLMQLTLLIFINYKERKIQLHYLHSNIKRELEICSYKLNCKNINVDFVKKGKIPILELIKTKNEVFMLFENPFIKNNYLKLSITIDEYNKKVKEIDSKLLNNFILELIFIIITSLIFSAYVLKPLKKAYELNETFIKDILHEFNTPLSSIKLNIYALSKKNPNNKNIQRIENGIKAILKLQENLKSFLNSTPSNKEQFDLKELVLGETNLYSNLYPNIKTEIDLPSLTVYTNKNALRSILSNIISNAFKYNKKNGKIKIYLKHNKLIIEDTGIGIKNPDKIFERFYKENKRGIGIGMNIVKKLCDELDIDIHIESEKNKGTRVILNIGHII